MPVYLIVACADSGVIGNDNELPWYIPNDLKRFKTLTTGNVVIMGRKTYESIGNRPLPNRTNVVITGNPDWAAKHTEVLTYSSLHEALEVYEGHNVFVIGGNSIFKEALETDVVDRIFWTQVHGDFTGDTFFPTESWKNEDWELSSSVFVEGTGRDIPDATFKTFVRREPE